MQPLHSNTFNSGVRRNVAADRNSTDRIKALFKDAARIRKSQNTNLKRVIIEAFSRPIKRRSKEMPYVFNQVYVDNCGDLNKTLVQLQAALKDEDVLKFLSLNRKAAPKLNNRIISIMRQYESMSQSSKSVRFDKRQTMGVHTIIKSGSSHRQYQLLNTLTPEDAVDLSAQHQVSALGKLVVGKGAFGKIRFVRDIQSREILVAKKTNGNGSLREAACEFKMQQKAASNSEWIMMPRDFIVLPGAHSMDAVPLEKAYMIMEFTPMGNGRELMRHLPTGESPLKLVIAQHMAKGVCDSHNNAIAHCDIKPENFLVMPDGKLRLMDFGLATDLQHNAYEKGYKGSPLFMAPELFQNLDYEKNDPWDPKSADVFSLGKTFLELVRGRHNPTFKLLSGDFHYSQYIKICDQAAPDSLESLALDMMHPDPAKRPTISSVLLRLEQLPMYLAQVKSQDFRQQILTAAQA